MAKEQSRFDAIGCWVSGKVADQFATPLFQVLVILICTIWFLIGESANVLTAILSVASITLTQMVLNSQQEREQDAHRRDVALHAKLDELLHASKRARDELAGIEELEEEQIQALRAAGATSALGDRSIMSKAAE